jgi:hypothetical protein
MKELRSESSDEIKAQGTELRTQGKENFTTENTDCTKQKFSQSRKVAKQENSGINELTLAHFSHFSSL